MTPDDKRRLAEIRQQHTREIDEPYYQRVKHFAWIDMDTVLRLLDEATAERDAAMAALRVVSEQLGEAIHTGIRKAADGEAAARAYRAIAEMPSREWAKVLAFALDGMGVTHALTAHSAVTKSEAKQ